MNILEFISKDRFAALLGIELLEASNGKAKAKLIIKEAHLNAVNIVQGGVIFSLADLTLAAAANSYGTVALALNASISFLKATGKGVLFAEAFETSRNKKIATYTINITDEQNELIANLHGMVYLMKETF